jgi:hypothetical protein
MHVEVHIPGAERIEALRAHIQRQLLLAAGMDTARIAGLPCDSRSSPAPGKVPS